MEKKLIFYFLRNGIDQENWLIKKIALNIWLYIIAKYVRNTFQSNTFAYYIDYADYIEKNCTNNI